MRIERPELKSLVVLVAKEIYGAKAFHRRPLMEAVEKRVKELGYWEASDDNLSGSVGIKSRGLANIDWAITSLSDDQGLIHAGRDQWCLPKGVISK